MPDVPSADSANPGGPGQLGDGVSWDWRTTLDSNAAGAPASIPVGFTNSGASIWQAGGSDPTEVGYVWLDSAGNVLSWTTEPTPLAADVAPGEHVSGTIHLMNPVEPGDYTLRIGLVRDGVWFQTPTEGLLVLDIGVPITPAAPEDTTESPPPAPAEMIEAPRPQVPDDTTEPPPPPTDIAMPAPSPSAPGPAQPAPSLHVSGNRIVDAANTRVTLLGVNQNDTDYLCNYGKRISADPLDLASVQAKAAWHVNTVRVPLSEECWLGGAGLPAATSGANYRDAVVNYVELLNQQGIVAILSDVELTPQNGSSPCCTSLTDMPNEGQTPAFWTSVASTFKGNNAVIFGLFNEPIPGTIADTPAAWKCLHDGGTCAGIPFTGHGPSYRVAGTQELVNAVRAAGAANIILVPGVRGDNVLSSWLAYKPTDPLNNLVASWHSYATLQCNAPACWNAQIGPVAAKVPVIADEIGQADCNHDYIDRLMSWLDTQQISYVAWSWWVGDCAHRPSLISDYSGTPTNFGSSFRDHLLAR